MLTSMPPPHPVSIHSSANIKAKAKAKPKGITINYYKFTIRELYYFYFEKKKKKVTWQTYILLTVSAVTVATSVMTKRPFFFLFFFGLYYSILLLGFVMGIYFFAIVKLLDIYTWQWMQSELPWPKDPILAPLNTPSIWFLWVSLYFMIFF